MSALKLKDAPQTEADTNPNWKSLGFHGSRFYFTGPKGLDPSSLTLPGFGETQRLDSVKPLISQLNRIADPFFQRKKLAWGASSRVLSDVSLRLKADASPSMAPLSGNVMQLTARMPEGEQSADCYLIYDDPSQSRRIQVREGRRYTFGFQVLGTHDRSRLSIRFEDDNENEIRIFTQWVSSDGAELTSDKGKACEISATAPAGATRATFFLRIEFSRAADADDLVDFRIGEPFLYEGDPHSRNFNIPSAIDPEILYEIDARNDLDLYFADRVSTAAPLGRDGRVNVYRDGGEKPVLNFDTPALHEDAVFRIGQFEGSTLIVNVKNYQGLLHLAVDGEVVSTKLIRFSGSATIYAFLLPQSIFDRDFHTVSLIDATSLRTVETEILHLPDHLTPWSALAKYCMPPLPTHLSPKAARWLTAIERRLSYFSTRETLSEYDRWLLLNLPRLKEVLVRDAENNQDFFDLQFMEVDDPKVSIVIPVHNEYPTTFHCLCSLLFTGSIESYEVIVVDDGSSDETEARLAGHSGITVVRRESAGGFVNACNEGASHARGEYVLFLNNDVEVTADWLDELLKVFEIFPEAGAACSKLLYPDGRLQDAGGIVYQNGQPANYGHGANPADPRYSYSRDADYLTGAALITPMKVWNEIGGFAQELAPAYFEDTWYSFAVRELGLRTIFCANSIVYHVRGVSNGDDVETETGLKRFQKINHPKFKRRWAEAYAKHAPQGTSPDVAKDRTAKKRILIVSWDAPKPDQNAGSYSTVQEIKIFQKLGFKVTFLPANLAYLGRYTEELQQMGVECIHAPFAQSAEDFLHQRGSEFDVILVSYYTVLAGLLPAIRKHAPDALLALNIEDLHFLREMRRAIFENDEERQQEVHKMREEELSIVSRADLVVSYSDMEIMLLEGLLGSTPKIGRFPWVQTAMPGDLPFEERSGLSFLGSHNHPPNAEAVEAFGKSIAPGLDLSNPDNLLHVYGSGWSAQEDDDYGDGVIIEGFAERLDDAFSDQKIFIAPLKSGAGLKGKVLAAMARGVPTILSPVAAEGMKAIDGMNCLIADTDAEWAEAIERLNSDKALWTTIRDNALEYLEKFHSPEIGVDHMRKLLERVDIYV